MDDITQFTSTSVDGMTLHFHYQVSQSVSDKNLKRFNSGMAKQIKTSVCKNPAELNLLNSGITLSFDYQDKNNNPLGRILLKPGDCPK